MKKIIALLLVLIMAIGLAACGGSASTPSSGENDTSSANDTSAEEPIVIELSMHHIWNSNTMYEQVFKDYFAYLEEQLDGKYKFDVTYYASGTLLAVPDVYQGVVDGVVQMGAFTCGNTMDIMPGQTFTQYPNVMKVKNASETSRILMEFMEYFGFDETDYEDSVFLSYFGTPNLCLYTNTPVYTPDDIKNMDIRCLGTWATSFTDFGAVPVTMPMSEIVESAQKGLIKGAMGTFIDYNQDLNLSQVFNCLSDVGCLAGNGMSVCLNQEFYDGLPEEVRQAFDDSHWYLAALGAAIWDYLANEAIEAARADGCTVVTEYTDEQYTAWLDAVDGEIQVYIDEMDSKGFDGQAMYDKLTELTEKYSGLDYTPYEPGVKFEPNYITPIA